MVERRDASCRDSHKYFPLCDCWFWKLYELQRFIAAKLLRSHCTHIASPFSMSLLTCAARPQPRRLLMSIETTSRSRIGSAPWPSSSTVDYCYNPHYRIRFVIL